VGLNTKLPFESDKFDVLLSLGTIHYEESINDVDSALQEMCRVVKDGGCALVQTTAPQHDIFTNSFKIGQSLYQLDMKSDLRHGQKFTFFEKSEDFVAMAKKYFTSVEVARSTETYPNQCVDVWLFKLGKN
jgi:ubiquinone/menaquinone biosynthesis C-methylase UbiE